MEKKIVISIILIIIAISCGTSVAADVSGTSTPLNYNNHTLTTLNSDQNLNNGLNKNNTKIIGNITRCNNGKPFQGVTVTVKSLNGTILGKTLSNINGSYILIFSGKQLSYNITAGYPGHVPSSKTVKVQSTNPSAKNPTLKYYGFVNFQLGPMPSLTITAPSTQLLNQNFNFNLNFNNTGNETGFGPMVQLILPSDIQLNSASFLGSPVTISSPQTFPISGILTDPLTGLTVTGTPGYIFYTLQYPLGSFTKGQPTAVINVNTRLASNSTLGIPLNITGYPVFRVGANETGTIPLRGAPYTTTVTPTVMKLTKTSNAHEQETVTGRNYPITYTLTVDVADGKTVNNVILTDIIPNNLQFIGVTSYGGGTAITLPSTITPGGLLSINLTNITGILGTDRIITYQVFAPRLDNSTNPIIDPLTGLPITTTNTANLTGIYNGTNVNSSTNYNLNLKSLAIQKGVVDETHPSAPRPTDILHYTVNLQVSDYFSIKELVITDSLGDGQTFLTDLAHNPTISLQLPNIGFVNLFFNLSDPNEFQMFHNSISGVTYLTFNVSQLLINNNYTGILEGGNFTGNNYGATQGALNFWSQININYENPLNHPIVSRDTINNAVTADSKLVNSNNIISDSSSSQVVIVSPSAGKLIYNVRRNGVDIGPTNQIRPGDEVTYSLQVNVPTTNLEDFYLVDYLPIPLFRANQFSTGQTPLSQGNTSPPTGQWRFASDDTVSLLTGVNPLLLVDVLQNTLRFNYGNIYNSSQPSSLVHILFTVTATGDPAADGLYMTNLLNVNYNNTFGEMFSDNQIVSMVLNEPQLTINKTATPNTGRQAGDVVTYTITIKNTGHAPAYNVIVTDNLLSYLGSYINGIPTVTAQYQGGSSIDLTGLGNLFGTGLNFGSLYPIFGSDETNNTIILTYNAVLNSNVYPLQVMNNTAGITNFTSLTPSNSTNFVTDPTKYQANATVTMLGPQFQKTYIGSQGGPSSGSNLTIGEKGRFRLAVTLPAGQINDLIIRDNLPTGLGFLNYTIINNPLISLPTLQFSQIGQLLTFSFQGIINTTYGANNTFYILYDFLVQNNNSTNPPHSTPAKVNAASMDWTNLGHTPLNSNATVNIIEPNLQIIKTFTPNIGAGGQNVVVNLQVRNIGNSTAYNVVITDPLTGSNNIFDLSSVQSYNQNGFIYTFPSNTVTFTGGNIIAGQTLNFTFNASVLNNVVIGPTFNNTAYANYYSLLNGTIPDINARNYTDSGWATFRAGDPSIYKLVVNSTIHGNTGNLAIGEHVTYRITVTAPKGQATNLRINDILPAGYNYVTSVLNSSSWTGFLPNLTTTITGSTGTGLIINFLFGGVTTSSNNNTFYIDLEAVVMNVAGNVVGNTKTNNVNLTWDENSRGPFTAMVNTRLIGPNLTIVKTVTPNLVDGSDKMNISLLVTNTGNSPAYEININDLLNSTLFDPSSFTFTPVAGYKISIVGYTINIIGDPGTFINNTGTNSLYFNFTVNATNNVPSNSTFTNRANGTYYSMPADFTDRRSSAVSSNIVNIKTVAPVIAKVVDSTSEPNSPGNNVMIGEVVGYRLNLTIPEGSTLNVSLRDILPSNLQYNTGTVRIMRNSDNITATGFTFTVPAGQFEEYTSSITPLLTFNLGNVTFNGIDGLHNGIISIIFNATVLNINANQNGTQIPNNITFTFTNATGITRTLTGVAPTLTAIVPHLSTIKTANPTNVEGGQTVTFTIQVSNDNISNGAPAYNLQVLDPLIGYNNLRNIIITTSSGIIMYLDNSTPNLLNITINQLNTSQYLNITYQADLNNNVTYGQQVNNTVKFTGTSLPGDHGTNNATPGNPGDNNGKRTGDPAQGAGAVNNLIAISTATVTVRSPTVSKNVNGQKNINRTIGDTANQTIVINVPIGTTNELKIIDVVPVGLQLSGFSYTTSASILVNQFIVTPLGGNTYEFNFGNITASQDGNISISYTALVQNVIGNVNGQNLTNNATLFYQNISGQSVNAGSDTSNIKIVEPNLVITKTSNKNNLKIGEQFTYTLLIKHSSSSTSDAYNIIIIDNLPNGLSYVLNSAIMPPTWNLNVIGNIITFTSPLLTLTDNNVTLTFNTTVNNNINLAGQNLTNTADMNYTSLAGGGRDYGPVTSTSQVHIIGADISVTKTGTSNIHAGQGISYTVTIRNLGPDTAENVTFTDTFISSWFNQLINPQYSLNGGSFTNINVNPWTLSLGNIISGNFSTIQIIATISPSATSGVLNNTANVTSNTTDPNPNNNNDTKLTTVDTLANLSISKNAAVSVVAGNSLVYTVVVTNNGPSDAQDVMFDDVIPVLTGVSWTLNGVSMGGWTGSYNLGVMAPGQIVNIVFSGLVPASTPNGTVLNNTAYITSPTDPNPHNASAVTNVTTHANLSLNKVNDPSGSVIAGLGLVYTLVLTNSGPSVARDVIFTDDQLSSYLLNRFYRYSINGGAWSVWTGFSGALVLNVSDIIGGPMGVGDTFAVMINSTVNPSTPNGTVINNFANVSSSTKPFNVVSPTVSNNVETSANLSISKNAAVSVVAGNSLVYTLVLTNNGPSDAQNVMFSDVIPVLTGVTWTLNGTPMGGWIGSYNLGLMIPGQAYTLVFTGLVPASTPNGTVLNNTANVTSPTDPNPHNATAITNVNTLANLSLTKVNDPVGVVLAGHGLVYTLVLTNGGPSVARDVIFTDDQLSSYLLNRFYRYSINGGAWSVWTGFSGALVLNVSDIIGGPMGVGDTFKVMINSIVNPSTPYGTVINNFANVTSSTSPFNTVSPTVTNNVETSANLLITKNAVSSVVAGNSLVYTVVVTNNGPSDAQNVMLDDVIPVLTGVTWSLNGLPMGGWTGFYNLGVMTPGQIITLVFTGLVPASTPNGTVLNNTASVTSPTDPVEHNSTAITHVNTQANLYIKKTGDSVVLPGGNINYTIFIKNNGPSDALNVHLSDSLDLFLTGAEYSLTGQIGSWYAWPPADGYLNLNTIPAGGNITVYLRAKILTSANRNINNTATVTSSTDPLTKKSTYISHLQSADLSITKKATPSKPYIHQKVKFTLIVQNHGPDTALNVYVSDKLPHGLRYLSSSANYGQYDPVTGIWSIGILPRGTIAVLNVIVVVEIVGPIQNHAHVYSSTYDPILNDTTATATVYVQSDKKNGNTIPMQNTGIPIIYMLIAGLLIGIGLIVPKRK